MTKEKGRAGIPIALTVHTAAFALGSVGGLCLAGQLSRWGMFSFERWMEGYVMSLSLQGAGQVSFWAVLWNELRWPLFVWLLGYTALGVWMAPVMFALRGFFLCFCVAGLSGAAQGGFLLALVLLGFGGAVTLPAFFFLGVNSWTQAVDQKGRLLALPADWGGRYLLRSALAFGGCIGWAGLEYWLVPILLKWLIPLF